MFYNYETKKMAILSSSTKLTIKVFKSIAFWQYKYDKKNQK